MSSIGSTGAPLQPEGSANGSVGLPHPHEGSAAGSWSLYGLASGLVGRVSDVAGSAIGVGSSVVGGAFSVAGRVTSAAFGLGRGAFFTALPYAVAGYQKITEQPPPETTSAGEKLAKVVGQIFWKGPNQALYALGAPIGGNTVVEIVSPNTLITLNSQARVALNEGKNILASFLSPLAPLSDATNDSAIKPLNKLEEINKIDRSLYEPLALKIKSLAALSILDSSLSIEQIKVFSKAKDPLKAYFSSLNFFPWVGAKIFYFFMRPILNSIFDWKTANNPGLMPQLLSLLRETLKNPGITEGFMASLLTDLGKTTINARELDQKYPLTDTTDLNERLISWLQKKISIKTGWPLIGPLIDTFINKKIFGFVKEQNIPTKIQKLFDYKGSQTEAVDPLKVTILDSITAMTSQAIEALRTSYASQLEELDQPFTENLLDRSADQHLPLLLGDDGEPLDLQTGIKNFTRYIAFTALSKDNRDEVKELSRFKLHLAKLQETDPRVAALYRSYEKELNDFLVAVGADRRTNLSGILEALEIGDKIEMQVDQALQSLIKTALAAVFKELSQETARESLLQRTFAFAEKLLTNPLDPSPDTGALQERFASLSGDLEQNIKQIISDTLEFQFDPRIQKKTHEVPNRYAVEWTNSLKREIGVANGTVNIGLQNDLDPTNPEAHLQTPEDIQAFQKTLQAAGHTLFELLSTYEKRLHQLHYEAPKGAFSDVEIQNLTTFIVQKAQTLISVSQTMRDLSTDALPALNKQMTLLYALQNSNDDALLEELARNGWDEEALTPFRGLLSTYNTHRKLEENTLLAITEIERALDDLRLVETDSKRAISAAASLKALEKKGILTESHLRHLSLKNTLAVNSLIGELERKRDSLLEEQIANQEGLARDILQITELTNGHILRLEGSITSTIPLILGRINREVIAPLNNISGECIEVLTKERLEAVEVLPETNQERVKPLVDSYLSFLGLGAQNFIKSPLNLHILAEAQLERLRTTLSS